MDEQKKYTSTDYHDFTSKDMPQHERRALGVGDIWRNAVECAKCADYIRSRNRHDMRWCSCRSVAVDGGSWYIRRAGDINNIIDHTEMFEDIE